MYKTDLKIINSRGDSVVLHEDEVHCIISALALYIVQSEDVSPDAPEKLTSIQRKLIQLFRRGKYSMLY